MRMSCLFIADDIIASHREAISSIFVISKPRTLCSSRRWGRRLDPAYLIDRSLQQQMSECVQCNIQKQKECSEQTHESDRLQAWVLGALKGIKRHAARICKNIPRVPAQETTYIDPSTAQACYRRHKSPACPA